MLAREKVAVFITLSRPEREWFKLQSQKEAESLTEVIRLLIDDLVDKDLSDYTLSHPRSAPYSVKVTVRCDPDLVSRLAAKTTRDLGVATILREELLRRYGQPPGTNEDGSDPDLESNYCPRCGRNTMLQRPEKGDYYCCNCRHTEKENNHAETTTNQRLRGDKIHENQPEYYRVSTAVKRR